MRQEQDIKYAGLWQTLSNVPNRIITLLLWKLVSLKGVFIALFVWLVQYGFLTDQKVIQWTFLVLFVLIIFDKDGLDLIKAIWTREKSNENQGNI